jgi:DNA primase
MARIPQAELERLKGEISVERLAQARGIELAPHGANLIGLCPFHDDHEPSLVITPANNLWHCLGACQAGGSVIDFVMRAEGVSFRHAVELLRGSVSNPRADEPATAKVTSKRALVESDVDDRALMREVVRYYHATLKQSAEALRYLESRGLGSAEMINRFEIGYANRTLGYRLPGKHIQAGAGLCGRLEHLGLLRSTGHECAASPLAGCHLRK